MTLENFNVDRDEGDDRRDKAHHQMWQGMQQAMKEHGLSDLDTLLILAFQTGALAEISKSSFQNAAHLSDVLNKQVMAGMDVRREMAVVTPKGRLS